MKQKLTIEDRDEVQNELLDVLFRRDMYLPEMINLLEWTIDVIKRIVNEQVTSEILKMDNRPEYLRDPQYHRNRFRGSSESAQSSSEQRPSTQDSSEPAPDQKA